VFCQVEENQRVERPGSGQLCTLEGLNAYSMMITIGKNRNSMINAAHTAHHVNGVIAVRNHIQFDIDDQIITGM